MKFLYRRSLFHLEILCPRVQVTAESRRSRELQNVDGISMRFRETRTLTLHAAIMCARSKQNVGSDPAGRGGRRLRAVDRLRVRLRPTLRRVR